MGQFHAWAVTGIVSKLTVWSDAQDRSHDSVRDEDATVRIATRLLTQQQFVLRSREGLDIGLHLTESGADIHNGDMITAVWAACEGSTQGRCVYVENHSTGTVARLAANVGLVRPRPKFSKIAGYGMLATIPSICAILTWLFVPGSLLDVDATVFLAGASIAVVVLFAIGAIVAKLVFDYLRSDDEEKIWTAARKAIAANHRAGLPRPRVPGSF